MAIFLAVNVDAGTSVAEAAERMAELAAQLRVTIEADFAGVKMFARPFQLPRDVLAEYERDCRLANYPSS